MQRYTAGESGGGGHPLWSVGLRGEGQLVGVGDSGLDLGSCWLRDPAGGAVIHVE